MSLWSVCVVSFASMARARVLPNGAKPASRASLRQPQAECTMSREGRHDYSGPCTTGAMSHGS